MSNYRCCQRLRHINSHGTLSAFGKKKEKEQRDRKSHGSMATATIRFTKEKCTIRIGKWNWWQAPMWAPPAPRVSCFISPKVQQILWIRFSRAWLLAYYMYMTVSRSQNWSRNIRLCMCCVLCVCTVWLCERTALMFLPHPTKFAYTHCHWLCL